MISPYPYIEQVRCLNNVCEILNEERKEVSTRGATSFLQPSSVTKGARPFRARITLFTAAVRASYVSNCAARRNMRADGTSGSLLCDWLLMLCGAAANGLDTCPAEAFGAHSPAGCSWKTSGNSSSAGRNSTRTRPTRCSHTRRGTLVDRDEPARGTGNVGQIGPLKESRLGHHGQSM